MSVETHSSAECGVRSAESKPRVRVITGHALARFRQRSGSNRSDERVIRRLFQLIEIAEEVRLKKEFRVLALLRHGIREAKYYRAGQWIFVVEGDVLKTVHEGEAKRWEPI